MKALLLVESNPTDEKLALHAFTRADIRNRIVVVRDGADALDYLFGAGRYASGAPPVPPAVVLLNLELPKIDGFEVLWRIRADPRTQLVPVVVLTSSTEAADLQHSYQLGANACVRKPVEFAAFVQTIRMLGSFWLLVNQPPPQPGDRPSGQ